MKTVKLLSFIALPALASSSLFADSYTTSAGAFWDTMTWVNDITGETGSYPRSGDDATLNIMGNFPAGLNGGWTATTKYLNDITFVVKGNYDWLAFQCYQGGTVFDIRGDWVLKSDVTSSRQEMFSVYNREASYNPKMAVLVGGNMSLSSQTSVAITTTRTNSAIFGANGYGGGEPVTSDATTLQYFTVKGNVTLQNKGFGVSTVEGANVNIGGQVIFADNKTVLWGNMDISEANSVIVQTLNVGGLSSSVAGAGEIKNYLTALSAKSSIITIANFAEKNAGVLAGGTFSGNISTNIAIVMDYDGATQKLIGTNTYTGDTSVRSGTLLISGNANTKVTITGGIFGFSDALAGASVDSLELNGGQLFFDFDESVYTITVADSLTSSLPDLTEVFTFANIAESNYILLSAPDMSAFASLDGQTISFTENGITYDVLFSVSATELSATFSQIPEPATYAAIFGALALALAAYRRKKK